MSEMINGRTPDAVSLNVSVCGNGKCLFNDCPYYDEPIETCQGRLIEDAAALVKHLEVEREQLLKDLCTGIICNCCKHADLPMNDPRCESCNGRNKFEWRGVYEPPEVSE